MAISTLRVSSAFPGTGAMSWFQGLLAALPAWVLARLLVLATFASAGGPSVLAWDAAWYHNLGVHGYDAYGAEGSRFFPLLPAVIGAGASLGLPAPAWQLAVCWVAALFFAAALYRLTVAETGDRAAGRRAVWLIQLVPGANVLALGYTEAFAGLLAVLYFLALRTRGDTRTGVAVGVLSGLVRPTGPLLAVPGVVEAVRSTRGSGIRRILGWSGGWRTWLVAVAPLLGTGAYLVWAWSAFGDPLLPYRIQSSEDLRGGVAAAPWEFLVSTSPGGYPWPLVLALLATAAVAGYLCWRLLPAMYVWWTVPMVGLAVTAWGLHSLPRYLAAIFPLWMAVAIACRRRLLFLSLMAISVVVFTWVAWLNVAPDTGVVP